MSSLCKKHLLLLKLMNKLNFIIHMSFLEDIMYMFFNSKLRYKQLTSNNLVLFTLPKQLYYFNFPIR